MDLNTLRHSCSHVLAAAVKEIFPNVKLGIGPAIEEGFYYDFDMEEKFTPEDLEKIEKKMSEILAKDEKFIKLTKTKAEAKKLLKNEPYKLELLKDIEEPTFYQTGKFIDLCAGPHVKSSKEIKAFKLLKIAGAYWKGDSKNKQLQRIYGIAFSTKKELDNYLNLLEEAEKRDHKKLGKELELFMMNDLALTGCPFFLPKGTIIYNELLKFIREEYIKRGYQEVITPQIFKKELWEMSGHWEHYKDSMFTFKIGEQEYSLKPMNCPSHILIYKSKIRSYKNLPLRIADFCPLHRNELGGVLGGLTRVVKMSQDDAHIFLAPEQVEDEILDLLNFLKFIYEDILKVEYKVKLSTRPTRFMGEAKVWDEAEKALANALKRANLKYEIKKSEGAFYGPKIDCDFKDSLKRDWQLATIQLDFQMPLKFDATYEGADGKKHTVVMVHRALLGSLERFIGVMIEHYAGKFPLWLSPVQVKLMTITSDNIKYAEELKKELEDNNIRVEMDIRVESMPKKVRDAQVSLIPLMVTIGEREEKTNKLAVRTLDGKVSNIDRKEFIRDIVEKIKKRC